MSPPDHETKMQVHSLTVAHPFWGYKTSGWGLNAKHGEGHPSTSMHTVDINTLGLRDTGVRQIHDLSPYLPPFATRFEQVVAAVLIVLSQAIQVSSGRRLCELPDNQFVSHPSHEARAQRRQHPSKGKAIFLNQ